jgi:NAD(P)-dependent dehydrogenase (short-subunit alcohol dehydrogenase family)
MSFARSPNVPPVAIVAGAASDNGTSVAHALAAHHRVLVVDTEEVSGLAQDIRAQGGEADSYRVDMSNPTSLAGIALLAEERLGPPNVYVHCAPPRKSGPSSWLEIPVETWDRTFEESVRSVWLGCRAIVPVLKSHAPASIVVVGGDGGASGLDQIHQATAMSALVGVVRSLAREVGDDHIAVNMICRSDDPGPNAAVPALARSVTAGGVADAVLFLCGPDAEFITGQSWLLNGGTWMQ